MPDIVSAITNITDRLNNRLIWKFARTRRPIPTNRPVISFTFDDVPDTALTNGAAILERYDARGTFYIAGGLEGRIEPDRRLISAEGCLELHARGHEIGCHTFSHRKISTLSSRSFATDLDRNERFLSDAGIASPATNFAFPYNAASPRLRHVLKQRYRTCRAAGEAINRGDVDPFMLKAVEIRQPEDHALGLTQWIDDVAGQSGLADLLHPRHRRHPDTLRLPAGNAGAAYLIRPRTPLRRSPGPPGPGPLRLEGGKGLINVNPATGKPALLKINNYFYRRGGAEAVFLDHIAMFEKAGWNVVPFAMQHELNPPSPWSDYFVSEIEYVPRYGHAEQDQAGRKNHLFLRGAAQYQAADRAGQSGHRPRA